MRFRYVLLASFFAVAGIITAPAAAANCTTSGNTTICSLGDGDEDDLEPERRPSSLPFVPYPCAYDYYCNEGYNWFTP